MKETNYQAIPSKRHQKLTTRPIGSIRFEMAERSYLEVQGGTGPDTGNVLGVSRVDLTNTHWRVDYEPMETVQ